MKKLVYFLGFLWVHAVCLPIDAQDSIVGIASYYANSMHGRKTASGERYDKEGYTCAHLKFKFGTKLKIKHLDTGKEVIVKVTDRGPYSKKYSIDLSYAAARDLGIIRAGHARVAIFPYDETMEHTSQVNIPSFMGFRQTEANLPHYEWKDTMKIEPLLMPMTQHQESAKKNK